jgi:hypothetical protein
LPVRQKRKRMQGIDLVNAHRRDSFQTPAYATELLIPFIPKEIKNVWEPACGDYKISKVLESKGYQVLSTDIKYGNNFLLDDFIIPYPESTCIITNPPFSLKKLFYDRCLFYKVPFALLIPTDYCGWIIDSIRYQGVEKLIPTRRVDYVTPSGLSGATGNSANFHSMWLTKGFELGKTETFVELTKEMKKNI